ncbi:MAG: metallothionein [Trichodesmium sp. MAG_R03]|nr:metallothionein [Trichodesmium sp. MAG_R03]
MSNVTQMKCACVDCLCVVNISVAVEKDQSYYCSEECANGHLSDVACCGHTGCNCHSK